MSKQITVSKATYEKLLECQKIMEKTSLNMTIVELALSFLQKKKIEKELKAEK